jgi:hypothetical protein
MPNAEIQRIINVAVHRLGDNGNSRLAFIFQPPIPGHAAEQFRYELNNVYGELATSHAVESPKGAPDDLKATYDNDPGHIGAVIIDISGEQNRTMPGGNPGAKPHIINLENAAIAVGGLILVTVDPRI